MVFCLSVKIIRWILERSLGVVFKTVLSYSEFWSYFTPEFFTELLDCE